MISIRKGDRGPAVEDVQRRLIALGTALGPTGVDGVFLGATYAAVRTFQRTHHLEEDGEVGPATWAALVDATFSLGDRLLYLRFPYFHGADVRSLQAALNALGFACGAVDGIFGALTEGAVRDFQSNSALAADGIVGPSTVRAVENLRHAWSDRSPLPPAELRAAPARSSALLRNAEVVLVPQGATSALADRIVNLAHAGEPLARLCVAQDSQGHADLTIRLSDGDPEGGGAVLVGPDRAGSADHLAEAIRSSAGAVVDLRVASSDLAGDEHALQALAVVILDGVCLGLADLE